MQQSTGKVILRTNETDTKQQLIGPNDNAPANTLQVEEKKKNTKRIENKKPTVL